MAIDQPTWYYGVCRGARSSASAWTGAGAVGSGGAHGLA